MFVIILKLKGIEMAIFRPFKAYRPKPEFAQEVAAKPYDVLNSAEARIEAEGHPYSFLHVGKPEIDLDPALDIHDASVYEKGKENLQKLMQPATLTPQKSLYPLFLANSPFPCLSKACARNAAQALTNL